MKQEQIQRINDELLRKTGVDFSGYRNQELTDTIANALTFPMYFARSVTRPVGLFLLALIVAIVLADSGFFKTFLGFPGLLLAIINGFLLGLVIFVRRIRNDMDKVFAISADISLQVVRDIGSAKAKMRDGSADFSSLLEIFQGVNAIVILPIIIRTLDRKIPFLGGLAARLTERFFSVVDARLVSAIRSKSDEGQLHTAPVSPQDMADWLQTAERIVEYAKSILSQVVIKVGKVVAFPFLLVFSVVFLLSAAILYGGYVMMG
jgi:hypothetical protein